MITVAVVILAALLVAVLWLPAYNSRQARQLRAEQARNRDLEAALRTIWDETRDKRDINPVADVVAGEVERVGLRQGEIPQ